MVLLARGKDNFVEYKIVTYVCEIIT